MIQQFTLDSSSINDAVVAAVSKYSQQDKRVFLISPSAMSVEFERDILSANSDMSTTTKGTASGTSLLNFVATRFNRLSSYFDQSNPADNAEITPQGLKMLFYTVLKEVDELTIPLYYKVRNSPDFHSRLVATFLELKESRINLHDLPESPKNTQLAIIFDAVHKKLDELGYALADNKEEFLNDVLKGVYNEELKQSAFLVRGYSSLSYYDVELLKALKVQGAEVDVFIYSGGEDNHSEIYSEAKNLVNELASFV